jgi:hypothetical protein
MKFQDGRIHFVIQLVLFLVAKATLLSYLVSIVNIPQNIQQKLSMTII